MANRPPAEVLITTDLVRGLLRAQHPDLADLSLEEAAEGWDNVIFRLGRELTVRLPRRQSAAELAVNEHRWLPQLLAGPGPRASSQQSPLRVASAPVRTGEPSTSYPWHWSITAWADGTVAPQVPVADRTPAAEDLADFVLAFQQPAPVDAPRNPVRGGALNGRDQAVQQRLDSLPQATAESLRTLWEELRDQPAWEEPGLWLHGDLHAANLVLGPGQKLRAVLDFGDLTAGDPATDLAAAWLVFDRYGRRVFQNRINAARPTSDATWQRARGWALCIGLALAAHSDDDPVFSALGQQVLHSVLVDHGTRLAGGVR
ncbi:aminoglycoside phosphotransferase family protein [Arthrobacter sp. CAN_A1]|uniref:aminoglycoside phosphotransferase family protein n=1 Tax=Arthrobacter sp. CAN_A1 TaxID=2787717 RepID=UPI0018CB8FCD